MPRSWTAASRCSCETGSASSAGPASPPPWRGSDSPSRRPRCRAPTWRSRRGGRRAGISPRVVEWIGEQTDVAGIERLAARISDDRSAAKVAAFATDLQRARQRAQTATAAALLEFTSAEIGLGTVDADARRGAHRSQQPGALRRPPRAASPWGTCTPILSTFPSWLEGTLRTPSAPGGVTLATVHKVKGLEWPHVIVHDATSGLFPHRLSTDVEEERRVFHVAITRAMRSADARRRPPEPLDVPRRARRATSTRSPRRP